MRRLALIFFLCLAHLAVPARAAELRANEYDLKAAFIFNFTQFVEWPTNAFVSETEPIIIAILGADPFGPALDALVRDEEVRGRSLKIIRSERPADLPRAHIVFISKSLSSQWPDLLRGFQNQPVLTVSDMDRFASRGGMIHLVTERSLIRMRINADAARRADIVISSKLLRLADDVIREAGGGAP